MWIRQRIESWGLRRSEVRSGNRRGGGIRTPDIKHPKLVHYQAVLLPECGSDRAHATTQAAFAFCARRRAAGEATARSRYSGSSDSLIL